MKIEPFLMERLQSTWEHHVGINLSESGVKPLTVRELLDGDATAEESLLNAKLGYTQTNGTVPLRQAIAGFHPGADANNVIVTVGCAEANHLVTWGLVEPGDEVVMMIPNYMQTWGLARSFGAEVKEWPLRPDKSKDSSFDKDRGRWRGDLDELRRLVTSRTKLILLCNPNNPTGSCLEASELDEIVRIAEGVGAWVMADEVYRGSEIGIPDNEDGLTLWGRYDRALVTGGLSKAYGLPGLRIGWVVGPAATIESLWSYHDYTTIAPAAMSDQLALLALEPGRRRELLSRTRSILRNNLEIITSWLDARGEAMTYERPQAGAMLYLAYSHSVGSSELVERLRVEKDVLVVPGDHYGMDGHLRIGFGYGSDHLEEGLTRIADLLASL